MNPTHTRACRVPLPWTEPPFRIVLVEPEIPPNTGNIARLCAATGTILHLVGPLGFRITDRSLRRAGLDYWDSVTIVRHRSWKEFEPALDGGRFFLFSTGGARSHFDARYQPGDFLIFGNETRGLPEDMLRAHPDRTLAIPIQPDRVRSLNLATAAGIALYEGLRQVASGAGMAHG